MLYYHVNDERKRKSLRKIRQWLHLRVRIGWVEDEDENEDVDEDEDEDEDENEDVDENEESKKMKFII